MRRRPDREAAVHHALGGETRDVRALMVIYERAVAEGRTDTAEWALQRIDALAPASDDEDGEDGAKGASLLTHPSPTAPSAGRVVRFELVNGRAVRVPEGPTGTDDVAESVEDGTRRGRILEAEETTVWELVCGMFRRGTEPFHDLAHHDAELVCALLAAVGLLVGGALVFWFALRDVL